MLRPPLIISRPPPTSSVEEFKGCNSGSENKKVCLNYLTIIRDIVKDPYYIDNPEDLQIILNILTETSVNITNDGTLHILKPLNLFKVSDINITSQINSYEELRKKLQEDPRENIYEIEKVSKLIYKLEHKKELYNKIDNILSKIYNVIYSEGLNSPSALKLASDKVYEYHTIVIKSRRDKYKQVDRNYLDLVSQVDEWLAQYNPTSSVPVGLLIATKQVAEEDTKLVKNLRAHIRNLEKELERDIDLRLIKAKNKALFMIHK